MFTIKAVSATDTGLQRNQNQDYCLIDEEAQLYVVADGLGGCPAGERASTEAVAQLQWQLLGQPKTLDTLRGAFLQVSHYVYGITLNKPGLMGMGTTMSAIWIDNGFAYLAHVGDSRIYMLRGENFIQLTTDHTLRQELLARGDDRGALNPRAKHLLTRTIGMGNVSVDGDTIGLQKGDRLLLCSDGVHGVLGNKMLKEIVQGGDPEDIVVAANGFGGPDNITAVFVSVS